MLKILNKFSFFTYIVSFMYGSLIAIFIIIDVPISIIEITSISLVNIIICDLCTILHSGILYKHNDNVLSVDKEDWPIILLISAIPLLGGLMMALVFSIMIVDMFNKLKIVWKSN